LKADTVAEIKKVCDDLGLAYQAGMCDITFQKNTSFRSDEERRVAISSSTKALCGVLRSAFRVVPLRLLQMAWYLKSARKAYLVPGSYGMIRDEFDVV
jgi:hypothetical protein